VPPRKLAAATEFSPGIVKLEHILELLTAQPAKNKDQLVEEIRVRYFGHSASKYSQPARRLKEQTKRANNVLIGLREYGLLEGTHASNLARELAPLATAEQHARLAKNILVSLNGIDVLRAVLDLQIRREAVNKDSLAEELRSNFSYEMPRDTTKHLLLLAWLRKAGVLPDRGYSINEGRVKELAGIEIRPLDEWQSMPLGQQAFVQVLRRLGLTHGKADHAVSAVLNQAEQEYGRLYVGGKTAAAVLAPLETLGWIETSGSTGGRGSKSGRVRPSQKLLDFDFELALGFSVPAIPADLRAKINRPLREIGADLTDPDTYVAGLALELLTLRLVLALGLNPVDFRKRDNKTGGGEVDVLAEGVHLHFSRWLVQCKNQQAAVTLSALAKEIGMSVLLHAHVIVIATTGRFAKSVLAYAEQVAQTTAMQVVLVDGDTLRSFLRGSDDVIKKHFRNAAAETLRLKSSQRQVTAEE
jgi:Restriction endonuclease